MRKNEFINFKVREKDSTLEFFLQVNDNSETLVTKNSYRGLTKRGSRSFESFR